MTSSTTAFPCQYYLSGKPESPYVYIDATQYLNTIAGTIPTFAIGTNTYFAHRVPASSTGVFNDTSRLAFNPDSFQILSAGLDGVFGNDDDMSNFWKGTRKEYLDSLQ